MSIIHFQIIYTSYLFNIHAFSENLKCNRKTFFVAKGRVYIGKMYPQLCKFPIPTARRNATEITEGVRIKSASAD